MDKGQLLDIAPTQGVPVDVPGFSFNCQLPTDDTSGAKI